MSEGIQISCLVFDVDDWTVYKPSGCTPYAACRSGGGEWNIEGEELVVHGNGKRIPFAVVRKLIEWSEP